MTAVRSIYIYIYVYCIIEIQQHIDRCSEYQHRERLGKDDMKRVREERDMTQRKLRQFEDEQTSLRNQVQELQKVRVY